MTNAVAQDNLPLLLTSLVGRRTEMAELSRLLSRTRLLTLSGSGGIGKTRLALAIASQAAPHYADGVWLVELAALVDPGLVPQAVAAVLGVRQAGARRVLDVLSDSIGAHSMLLVLDNCEHLLDACAALSESLLQACPGLRILVTSRESLRVPGETVWRVPSMGVPAPESKNEHLEDHESVRLFVERARAVEPNFQLTSANATAAGEICRRLDGIPLAIELAAACVETLAVPDIAARLDDRFRLLAGGGRNTLPRQQTLKGTLDWSYALLRGTEKVLFDRLAVFHGGWTLESAEAVCAGDSVSPDDVLQLIAGLVRKSLVLSAGDVTPTRFRMLDSTRHYGLEQLQKRGEQSQIQRRHAEYFRHLAEQARRELLGPGQLAWLKRLDDEQDNCRGALRWFVESGSDADLDIVASLWDYWWIRGLLSEGRRLTEAALSRRARQPSQMLGRAVHGAGLLAAIQGEMQLAAERFGQSVDIFRELDDRNGMVRPECDLASTLAFVGEPAGAMRFGTEALKVARNGDDPWSLAYALHMLGQVHLTLSHYRIAAALSEEGVRHWRDIGDGRGLAHELLQLAIAVRGLGEARRAIVLTHEGMQRFSELGETWGMLGTMISIAASAADLGDPGSTARLVGAAEALSRTIGATPIPAWQKELEFAQHAGVTGLGASRAERAFSAGRLLSMREAVAFAITLGQGRNRSKRTTLPDRLTAREAQVLVLVARRYSNREIADALVLSVRTVERHIANIYGKAQISSRRGAAEYVRRHDLFVDGLAEVAAD